MISPVSDSLLTPIAATATAVAAASLAILACRVGHCFRRAAAQTPGPAAAPAPERSPSPPARLPTERLARERSPSPSAAAADAAPVEDLPTWQRIAEGLNENENARGPAREILAIVDPNNAQEVAIDEIVALLKAMHVQNNYSGLSELLDVLEEKPAGPIFEALKVLSEEIIASWAKAVINSEGEVDLGNEYITHILAKAIQDQKPQAVSAISSSIPYILPAHKISNAPCSGVLMQNCLELVIYDKTKTEITKQILANFAESAKTTIGKEVVNFDPHKLFSLSTNRAYPFDRAVDDLYKQLYASTCIKSAGKKDVYNQHNT